MTAPTDSSGPSATVIVAIAAYLAVMAVGAALFLAFDHPELVALWFGIAGATGVGHAIFGRLGTVANAIGTQQVSNGTTVIGLERYTHDSVHTINTHLTVISNALVKAGLLEPDAIDKAMAALKKAKENSAP